MKLRKASRDDFKEIAPLMLLAMDDIIYHMLNSNSEEDALQFLHNLIQKPNNQYSYENIWLAELDGQVVAMANIYDGGKLHALREPIIQELKNKYNRDFELEDETEEGEYYIDSISVNPNFQGKGIGSKFLQALIEEHVTQHQRKLGLLVDVDNTKAKRLYIKHGFEPIKEVQLGNKNMEHLELNPK